MTFQNIPGHTELKAYFSKIVSSGRVPHAILLTGGEGYGKLALSWALATYLQCKNKGATDACGECTSCRKALQNIHPDIHFAFPVIKKDKLTRAETTSKDFIIEWRNFLAEQPYGDLNEWLTSLGAPDKNPNINVAECNHIIKNLGLMTYEGAYKIQIIWYAELLGKEGNRLLKLIEEPSDDTIIILIANNRTQVLNTLRSRCQIVSVAPVDDASMLSYIGEKYDLNEEDTQELAFLSAGNLRKASFLGNTVEMNYSEQLLDWLRAGYSGDPEKLVAASEELAATGRQEITNFLEYGLHFFREYFLFLNIGDENLLRLTATEKSAAMKMTKIIDHEKIERLQQLFEKSSGQVKRNLNLKSLMMHMSLEINNILRSEVNNLVT